MIIKKYELTSALVRYQIETGSGNNLGEVINVGADFPIMETLGFHKRKTLLSPPPGEVCINTE